MSPPDLAVLILAACIPLAICGHIYLSVTGATMVPSSAFANVTEYWMQFLTFIAGGIFGWVAPRKSSDDDH